MQGRGDYLCWAGQHSSWLPGGTGRFEPCPAPLHPRESPPLRYSTARRRPILPRSDDPDEEQFEWAAPEQRTSIEVDELVPQFTGLYDEHGDPIYRMPEPIGF